MSLVANSPNLLSQRRMARLINQIRAEGNERRTEAVTGRVSSIRKSTQGQVGKIHMLEKALTDTRKYRQTLDLANYRLAAVDTALGSLTSISERVNRDVLGALNFKNPETTRLVADEALAALGTAFATLNLQTEGRFVFSGNTIDTAPMGDLDTMMADLQTIVTAAPDAATALANIDTYFDDPAGGFMTSIYTGSDTNAPDMEIGQGQRIELKIRADDQGIKNLLKGLAVISIAGQEGAQDEKTLSMLQAGSGQMIQAQYDIINISAQLGNSIAQVGAAETMQSITEQTLSLSINDLTTVDQLEAATLMQALDLQLESSFAATARIGELTLLNYLR